MSPELIDTHAHLDDPQFQNDLPAVLQRAAAAGVSRVVAIGTTAPSSAACVELAVLAPFIMFMFAITVDFARVLYYSQIVENCARQGALYASDSKSPTAGLYSTVSDAALADASGLSPQPAVSSTSGTDSSGNPCVVVTVTWPFQTLTNFPGVPSNATISSTVQMRSAP